MVLYAFFLAAGAAISLPIGAVIGTVLRPGPTVLAAILSFGAGVLLSAISFELIEEAFVAADGIGPVAFAAIVGALTFIGLNRLLDNMGGFLRKAGTLVHHTRREKRQRAASILEDLSKISALRALPADEIQAIVPYLRDIAAPAGSSLVEAGQADYSLYLVLEGELEVWAEPAETDSPAAALRTLGPGDAFGEVALLTGEPRQTTIRARTQTALLQLRKGDFDRLVSSSPRLAFALTELAAERLAQAEQDTALGENEARRWRQIALRSLHGGSLRATALEERELANATSASAALGIYLGLVLDGISESIAIGALQTGAVPSLAFLAAVFVSNLPESMSSSALMRNLGYGPIRLVVMWGGIVVVSGLAAALGAAVFADAPGYVLAGIYAFTAGAILAMLAQTAMPEAYEHGGSVVGICTVLGFLTSYYIGTLQHAY